MAKTRVDLITKSLREYTHTLESSYYSACITYNVGKSHCMSHFVQRWHTVFWQEMTIGQ